MSKEMEQLIAVVMQMTQEITRLIESQDRLTQALIEADDYDGDEESPVNRYLS